ncbi:hypothetical protein C9374_008299 [Naegleria lovaniensis]|uniref:Uncharacterized protein n=1 Tax=Naegleria lovaniensis TaxID=51637 RepID=A0AA88GK96_NAELO|nr:uncharacterized protein C9374_008299 [Naegleria lovaniensis]KAG2378660.1 hypothetical protein C9374_008299 [Naegleria lovaniensis]
MSKFAGQEIRSNNNPRHRHHHYFLTLFTITSLLLLLFFFSHSSHAAVSSCAENRAQLVVSSTAAAVTLDASSSLENSVITDESSSSSTLFIRRRFGAAAGAGPRRAQGRSSTPIRVARQGAAAARRRMGPGGRARVRGGRGGGRGGGHGGHGGGHYHGNRYWSNFQMPLTPQARRICGRTVRKYDGAVGPKVAKTGYKRAPFNGLKCVACEVDCANAKLDKETTLFEKCETQFHYYGCKLSKPCFSLQTAAVSHIEAMIAVCMHRNGCVLKEELKERGLKKLARTIKKSVVA